MPREGSDHVSKCVLFLDVDGVLNGHEFDPLAASCGIRPDCVERLNRVLDATGCDVVLSSAWRYMVLCGAMTLEGFGYLLRTHGVRQLGDRLVGTLPFDTADDAEPKDRGDLIAAWLAEHPGYAKAVAVDDLDIFDPRLPHVGFVRTDGMKGLADADADQLVALLRPCPGQKPAAAPAGGGE